MRVKYIPTGEANVIIREETRVEQIDLAELRTEIQDMETQLGMLEEKTEPDEETLILFNQFREAERRGVEGQLQSKKSLLAQLEEIASKEL
jgi:hypothetical protein